MQIRDLASSIVICILYRYIASDVYWEIIHWDKSALSRLRLCLLGSEAKLNQGNRDCDRCNKQRLSITQSGNIGIVQLELGNTERDGAKTTDIIEWHKVPIASNL